MMFTRSGSSSHDASARGPSGAYEVHVALIEAFHGILELRGAVDELDDARPILGDREHTAAVRAPVDDDHAEPFRPQLQGQLDRLLPGIEGIHVAGDERAHAAASRRP